MTSSALAPSRDISRLLEIMRRLRTPDTGCPWDLEQTFATISPYTIEEAYEVADAISRGDLAELRDELGDLLLQVAYHARMAEERQAFDFGDVVEAITAKMIRRHPHVFGDEATRAAGAPPGFWAKAKAAERAQRQNNERDVEDDGLLADVPLALPALSRAVKLQSKAAEVGFDWPHVAQVMAKMKEELAELEVAVEGAGSSGRHDRGKVEEEFGDLLFVLANVARHLRIDPEAALRSANAKFVRRFRHIEQELARRGRTPEQSTLAEMDGLWDDAKRLEGSERT
jgi:ATP diphosphatase